MYIFALIIKPKDFTRIWPTLSFALCPCFGKTYDLGLYLTHNIIIHASQIQYLVQLVGHWISHGHITFLP
jgi:hypothetical protein